MRAWLRGAGDDIGACAVQFGKAEVDGGSGPSSGISSDIHQPTSSDDRGGGLQTATSSNGKPASSGRIAPESSGTSNPFVGSLRASGDGPTYAVAEGAGGDEVAPATEELVVEAEFREVYFTHAGGYDQQIEGGRSPQLLDDVGHNTRVPLTVEALHGKHTLVHVGRDRLRAALPTLKAIVQLGAGTRVTVVSDDRLSIAALKGCGYGGPARVRPLMPRRRRRR